MIARGDIGIPIGYSFRFRRKDGVGPEPYPNQTYFRKLRRQIIDETLVHHMDTARFIFGDITSVYGEALRRNPGILGEDYAILTMRHLKDVIGTIDGNRFLDLDDGPGTDEASFEGESGSIRITARCDIWSGSKKIWTNDVVSGYRGDSVYATQAHFVDCLETGRPCESSVGRIFREDLFRCGSRLPKSRYRPACADHGNPVNSPRLKDPASSSRTTDGTTPLHMLLPFRCVLS